ncbi:MAG: epimerase [Firmicutes bacterium]|nr:epimerase [Bacillota bacterium]
MGNYLVDQLSSSENNIVVTTRLKREAKGSVKYVQGNAKDEEFFYSVISKHWDVIIDFMVYKTSEFQERITPLLNATNQYVFLSSSRVYAESGEPLKETSPRLLDQSKDYDFLRTDEYSLTKARQENLLINSGKSNWTIVRPYITFGDYRLQLGTLEKEDWLYRALRGRTIVFSSDIAQKMTTMTHGLDVAKGIASLIGDTKAFGEIFHITTPKPIMWSEVLDTYLNAIGILSENHPKIQYINIDDFHKLHSAKYQINYDRMYDRVFDNSKIDKFIDVDNFGDSKDRLTMCLANFLEQPQFKNINWKAEALKDKITKEVAKLSEITGIKQKLKYFLYRFVIS